jgi:phosphocarrier protein HPr
MLRQKITIINKLGLHARASMQLINLAGRFQSNILINYNDREVNAKSIMNVMAIAASQGSEIELIIDGEDEQNAMHEIVALINNRFGEAE